MRHSRRFNPSGGFTPVHVAHVAMIMCSHLIGNVKFEDSVLKRIGDKDVLVPGDSNIAFLAIATAVMDNKSAIAFNKAHDEIRTKISQQHEQPDSEEREQIIALFSAKAFETSTALHDALRDTMSHQLPFLKDVNFYLWYDDFCENEKSPTDAMAEMITELQKRNAGMPVVYLSPDSNFHEMFLNALEWRGLKFDCIPNRGQGSAPTPSP